MNNGNVGSVGGSVGGRATRTTTTQNTTAATTTLGAIPTISAAVSSSNLAAVCRGDGGGGASPQNPLLANGFSTMQLVQQKFKDNENVLTLFEAYRIVGQEYTSRLLALVVSVAGGTYAVFSMTAIRLPPLSSNDLTIDKVFPLNESFRINTDIKGSISQLQFELRNTEERPAVFYYYPNITTDGAVDFVKFQSQVLSAHSTMSYTTLNPVLSFSWLNEYRQIGEAKQELKRREHEYIIYKDFKIYCATWNVNNQGYHDSPLHLWLSACAEPPDIYAIALQELDTSAKALTFSENRPDAVWIHKMLQSVHNGAEYEELTSVRLVGMMLTIIVRKKIRPYIARCRVKSIARGVFNVVGNKGGVAVSLQLNEGNICFVNSHLAAHTSFVEARNEDYAGIVKGLIFDDDHRRGINDHDHIFWIGDLNYRIEQPPGLQLCLPLDNTYEALLKYDQLNMEMRKGNCFSGYTEGKIRFRPTYKYDVGTDNFDSSEKQRAPAYCDRILWKGVRIEQTAYDSVMDIRQSDHKPVYACFNVKIKSKDEKLYKRIHEEVLKLVDKRENENQPQITVEKTVIDFGVVQFNESVVRDFTVSNNCPMAVTFMFKKKDPPLNDICERWLQVEPRSDSLSPDSVRSIRVKLKPDSSSIRGLLKKIRSTGNWKFDFDILILHVKSGPDIFLTLTGEYKPSCFGLSMETLCRTTKPLCEYTQEHIKDLMNDKSPEFRVTMPREFFLLIDYIHKQGNNVAGAFASLDYKHSREVQFNEVRDWLDTWSTNEFPCTPHAAAEALLMLLDLPEKPLLDPYVEDLLKTTTTSEAMEYIALLSSPKRNVFVHLCMFLCEGIKRRYYNLNQVAVVLGRVLLRSERSREILNYDARCYEFMHRFIGSDLGTLSSAAPTSTASAVHRGGDTHGGSTANSNVAPRNNGFA